eukprot:6022304-Pyramimonas_sp.AAC.1
MPMNSRWTPWRCLRRHAWRAPRAMEGVWSSADPRRPRGHLNVDVCAAVSTSTFTEEFCDALLAEIDHLEASGIPLRRPNGMNRYGAILSQL